jgi:hypothetical protein
MPFDCLVNGKPSNVFLLDRSSSIALVADVDGGKTYLVNR